jgi:hypothetical protein
VDRFIPLGGTGGVDAAVEHAMAMGPSARALNDAGAADDPALQARARTALHAALSPHATPNGVLLRGATWIVTARAS